ncbi:MAG: AAA family ATPase [Candidatus Aenigmatarchaeota archaeon]
MIINVISLKGGVGKTTISINLAAYLRKEYNKRILLVDSNFNNYSTKLFSKFKLKEYGERLYNGIYPLKYFHLKILRSIPKEIEKDLELLKRYYDYIIFDLPNDLEIILNFEKVSNLNLRILNSDIFSLFSNYYLFQLLDKNKTKLILNKYDGNKEIIKFIERKFGKKVSTVISFDKEIEKINYNRIPIIYSRSKRKIIKEFDELASLITGKRKKFSIFERILSLFL